MGKMYSSEGEILEFAGIKDVHVTGSVETDGMGRTWINEIDMAALLPEDIREELFDDGRSQEYQFTFKVTAYRPTGEFRDSDPHPSETDNE